MMKKTACFFVCLLFLFLTPLFAAAEGEADEIAAEAQKALFSAFDSETRDTLSAFGLDEIGSEKVFDSSFESLTDYFRTNLKEKAQNAVKMLFEVLCALIIVFIFERHVDVISVCLFEYFEYYSTLWALSNLL